MTVQAAEAVIAAKSEHDQKKAAKKQKAESERQAELGAQPAPKKKTDASGNATFRGEKSGGKGSGRGGGRKAMGWAWSGNRKILTAQFVLCSVILILGLLTSSDDAKNSSARALVKGSALALLFFLLALLSSAGGSSAKAATAMGALVTVAYAVTSSDVHAVVKWVGTYFKTKAPDVGTTAAERSDEQMPEPLS